MPNFDGTVDNRWRPDFQSSWRRVREEESGAVVPRSASPSLPMGKNKCFEPHDAQTAALIRRMVELERLPHGTRVSELLERWEWIDKMKLAEEKQRFLEPLIESVRRDPEDHEDLVIFLMLVFEPVRRSVSKAFVAAHSGLTPQPRDINWSNRQEARMIRSVERERLYDVTREAALEAVFRYPTPAPVALFPWLRETIAHRALDKLRGELPEIETSTHLPAEAEALQRALAGFDQVDEPSMRERRGLRKWLARIQMRGVFDVVDEFYVHDPVRNACSVAIGRLPKKEREVIHGYFFEEVEVPQLAASRRVTTSTIYNQKASAQKRLGQDEVFFSVLCALCRVRDKARAEHLAELYPDGVLPDGRRLVVIDQAA